MKIRVYGGSGSGKTYLTSRLHKELDLPVLHLDDVFYDQSQPPLFSVRRDVDEALLIIKNFLEKKDWVIDGGWYSLEQQSYDECDVLIYLQVPLLVRCFHILKRFIRRKKMDSMSV